MVTINREDTKPEQIERAFGYFEHIFHEKLNLGNCDSEGPIYVVGGCLRDFFEKGYLSSDIDLMFKYEKDLSNFKALLEKNHNVKNILENENVIKIKVNGFIIDLIRRNYYSSLNTAIGQFDFTVCTIGMRFEGSGGKNDLKATSLVHHDTFFMDLAGRKLVINSIPVPLSTLQRLQKYIKKGYTICNGGLIEISRAISEIDMDNPDENELEFYDDGEGRIPRVD